MQRNILANLNFLLIAAVVFLSSSSASCEEIELAYKFLQPELTQINQYTRLEIKGLDSYGPVGEPVLPHKTCKILLPQGQIVEGIQVIAKEKTEIGSGFLVNPAQDAACLASQEPWQETLPAPEIYNSYNPYPLSLRGEYNIQTKRGYDILIFSLNPVEYVPKSGRLSYYKQIDVVVTTKSGKQPINPLFRNLPEDRLLIQEFVDNPRQLNSYRQQTQGLSIPLSDPKSDYYPYVIITSEELVGIDTEDYNNSTLFSKLKRWKIQNGLSATVVTTQWIYNNYSGYDNAEKIKNFISYAYDNWCTDYVLLGGDVEVLPTRHVCTPKDDNTPSEMYFGCLDNNWDANGNHVYAEYADNPDLLAEVHIGRAPVNTEQEINNFIAKTIAFDNASFPPLEQNALMIGCQVNDKPLYGNYWWGSVIKEAIVEALPDFPNHYNITKLYDSNSHWITTGEVINSLNNGGNFLVNHVGHDDHDCIGASSLNQLHLTRAQVANLGNPNPFLFYSVGCWAASFDLDYDTDGDAVGEYFVFSPYAAVCFIGNTRNGYGALPVNEIFQGASNKLDIQFFDKLFETGNLAIAHEEAKEHFIDQVLSPAYPKTRHCFLNLVILGDPDLEIIPIKRLCVPLAYPTIQQAVDSASVDKINVIAISQASYPYYQGPVTIPSNKIIWLKGEEDVEDEPIIKCLIDAQGLTGISANNAGKLYLSHLAITNASRGIDFSSSTNSSYLKLRNVLIYECGQQGLYLQLSGSDQEVLIRNLTISENGLDGIRIRAESATNADILIKNSIVYLNGRYGIKTDSNAGNSINISYSDLFWNASGNFYGPYTAGEGLIEEYPYFWSSCPYCYLEEWHSPCIDTGDPADIWWREVGYPNGHIDMGGFGNTIWGGTKPNPSPPGGGGGHHCFVSDTPILMAGGSLKPIQEVNIGDEVLAFDEETGQFKKDAITKTFKHRADKYLIINGHLKVTENHPVYSEGKWIEIGKLDIGDKLLDSKGRPETITSIKQVNKKVSVYNLEVNPYHTYIAGGIVVHNKQAPVPGFAK